MKRAFRKTALPALLATAAAALALTSGSAAAEEPAAERGETTSYDFEDDLVTGDTVQPGLEVLHVRKRGERSSLVRARMHYVVELLESAERL